jgi:hypothetical protein
MDKKTKEIIDCYKFLAEHTDYGKCEFTDEKAEEYADLWEQYKQNKRIFKRGMVKISIALALAGYVVYTYLKYNL